MLFRGAWTAAFFLFALLNCGTDSRITTLDEWDYRIGFDRAWLKDRSTDGWKRIVLPVNFTNHPDHPDLSGRITLRRKIPREMANYLKAGRPLALNAGRVLDVSFFYINGELFGQLGSDEPYQAAAMRPFLKDIPFSSIDSNDNYLYIVLFSTGKYPLQFMDKIEIGPSDEVYNRHANREVAVFALLMAYVSFGLYHILLFVRRPKENYNLYFGLFAIAVAFYWFVANTTTRDIFFADFVEFHRKLEHSLLFLLPPLFLLFLNDFFQGRFSRVVSRIVHGYGAYCALSVLITMAGPLWLMRHVRDVWYLALLLPFCLTAFIIVYEAFFQGNRSARILAAGTLILIIGVVHDILVSVGVLQTPSISRFTFLLFVISMIYLLVTSYARSHSMAEELSRDLEQKVLERTEKLTRMTGELEEARDESERNRQEVEKLSEFTRRLNESTDLDSIFSQIFSYMLFNFNLDGVWLLLVNESSHEAVTTHHSYAFAGEMPPDRIHFLENFHLPLNGEALGFQSAYEQRRPMMLQPKNAESMSELERDLFETLGLQSLLLVPLVVQDTVIALLCCTQLRGKNFELDERDRSGIFRFAEHIGGAIHGSDLLEQVAIERERSDKLLLNILPEDVADELKERGEVHPLQYESVTVLFTDLVGFTQIAERLPPAELLENLDACFTQFDEIINHHSLEKLKTIGDAYMCCGGLPRKNFTHPIDAVLAALEFQRFMNQVRDIKSQMNLPYWELRVGLHTGPVTAGVVGKNKFAYDIWGDTVNIASRMESSGAAGRVNISRATYDEIKYFFECEARGKVQAKGKGLVEMFFVNRLKPAFSADPDGAAPNDRFYEIYKRIQSGAKVKFKQEVRA